MTPTAAPQLDSEALAFFAAKGLTGGRGAPVGAGQANGARVRRVLQATADLGGAPLDRLRILDLACGDGVFSIEAALHGAEVVAVDARTSRMHVGQQIAARLGLAKLRFEQMDIRQLDRSVLGQFDVIYALGILYHLELEANLGVLRAAYEMCRKVLIIDTTVAPEGEAQTVGAYEGVHFGEHAETDSASAREARPLASLDNTQSFLFTKASLCRALRDVGFTSAFEYRVPLEPTKPGVRATFVAIKGQERAVQTYPWINGKTEDEIAAFLASEEEANRAAHEAAAPAPSIGEEGGRPVRGVLKQVVNGLLQPLGLELRRRG